MKEVKHEEHFYCDKCKEEIADTVYTLRCNAFAVGYENSSVQSTASAIQEKQLCEECKDKITDGIFIK